VDHLESDDLETALLEAGEDGADECTLHAVGLSIRYDNAYMRVQILSARR
jgi:hypothetical protein